jgi:rhamnogalacturonan endolyase
MSVLPDAGSYTGSTQNGVTTQSASASGGSFKIISIAAPSEYTLAPVNVGSYVLAVETIDANYTGTATGTLVITQATTVITWIAPSAITYGTALGATQLSATANVPGTFVYTPASGTVLNAGAGQTLSVTFTPTDAANYTTAGTTTTIDVSQATPVITWAEPSAIIYGTALSATQLNATANVPGTFIYTPTSGTVLNAGAGQTLSVTFTPTSIANYTTAGSTTMITVNKATATVILGNLSQTYDGAAKTATASTTPSGLGVNLTYSGSASAPINAGNYLVAAIVVDANYTGSATGTLTIVPATATLTLGGLKQAYDGTPRVVTATTVPAGLAVHITYNGDATAPIYPGTYPVLATITDANYIGSASGSLVISTTALVRHAPTLNGDVDGSVQMLLGENVTFNSSAGISNDLLVPGTPAVVLNGTPTYGGAVNGPGSASPTNYTVVLNTGALLSRLVCRIDPLSMPTVSAPPTPTGTRSVSLNSPSQSPGDFATLKNLTLNSNVGPIAVPPGTYGNFTANSGSSFVLGVTGATEPAVYNFQSLTLNSNTSLQVVGPVIITVNTGFSTNGNMGTLAHPEWLKLCIASGGLSVNSVTIYGSVLAPSGTIALNSSGRIFGNIASDRLTLNTNTLLSAPSVP